MLLKRPPAEKFQNCVLFSAEHGILSVFVRLPGRTASRRSPSLDLFEEVAVELQSSNQGRTWFLNEARILARALAIGRSYEALHAASVLATLFVRNPPPPESRTSAANLFRTAIAAFAGPADPAVVLFKSMYRFARDEGHPLSQQWIPSLPAELRGAAEQLLRTPLAELARTPAISLAIPELQRRLEEYLRGNTEILID